MSNNIEPYKDKKYQFNPDWYNKFAHSDINKVIEELDCIHEAFGQITAENIVQCAKNKKSVLHSYFEWDDQVAASKFRIKQASILLANIQVVVVKDGKPKTLRAYETVIRASRQNGIIVKSVDIITGENIQNIAKFTIGDLGRISNRLSRFECFEKVIEKINSAIQELEKEPQIISIEPPQTIPLNGLQKLLADKVR